MYMIEEVLQDIAQDVATLVPRAIQELENNGNENITLTAVYHAILTYKGLDIQAYKTLLEQKIDTFTWIHAYCSVRECYTRLQQQKKEN
jgi:hypothetical protein